MSALAERLTDAHLDEASHTQQPSPREVLAWLGCLDSHDIKPSPQVTHTTACWYKAFTKWVFACIVLTCDVLTVSFWRLPLEFARYHMYDLVKMLHHI